MNAKDERGPDLTGYSAGEGNTGRRPRPPIEDERDPMDPPKRTESVARTVPAGQGEAESLLQLNVRMSAESRADLGRLLDVWPGRRPTFRDVIEDLITAESARPPGSSSRMTDAGPRSNGPQVTAQLNVRISASSRAELGQLVMVWGGRRPAIRDVIEDLVAAELARRGLDDSS